MNLLREKGDAAPYSLCRLNDSEMNLLKPFFFFPMYIHAHSLTHAYRWVFFLAHVIRSRREPESWARMMCIVLSLSVCKFLIRPRISSCEGDPLIPAKETYNFAIG